jgi:hypothetical protein
MELGASNGNRTRTPPHGKAADFKINPPTADTNVYGAFSKSKIFAQQFVQRWNWLKTLCFWLLCWDQLCHTTTHKKPNFQSKAVLACSLCVLSECFVFYKSALDLQTSKFFRTQNDFN